MRTYKDAKAMAKSLRDSLAARNVSLAGQERTSPDSVTLSASGQTKLR